MTFVRTPHGVFLQRCGIERLQRTDDGGGSFDEQWVPHLEDVPCRTWFVSGREYAVGSQVKRSDSQILILPKGTDIKSSDRITMVQDRNENLILEGPMEVEAIGQRAAYVELRLEVKDAE